MGCGCVAAALGLFVPRFVLFLLWIFGDRLSYAFDSFVIGFIGFLLLPYTTLFWALAYQPVTGVTGFGWFVVALGVVFDIGHWAGSGQAAQQRRRQEA
jgi:hypothetical protein